MSVPELGSALLAHVGGDAPRRGPHEDLNVGGSFIWTMGPTLKAVEEYEASPKAHPHPTPATIINFGSQ